MYFKQLIYFHSIATFEMEPKICAACVDINFRKVHSVIWLEKQILLMKYRFLLGFAKIGGIYLDIFLRTIFFIFSISLDVVIDKKFEEKILDKIKQKKTKTPFFFIFIQSENQEVMNYVCRASK